MSKRYKMNQKLLANKLRKIREAQKLSQQMVADALELPRTAITQIENGNRAVSTLELMKFAKLYRKTSSYFLEDSVAEEEEVELVLYRMTSALSQESRIGEKIQHYVDLCKEGISLKKILGSQVSMNPPQYSISIPENKAEAVEQGNLSAEQERKRLSLGNRPITDLMNLITEQGIWACSTPLPDEISGLFLNSTKTGCIILVNANHVVARKRFSYAHEYAHVLFDRNEPASISSIENNSDYKEIRANAFTASFLMPAQGIQEALENVNKGKASRQNQILFDVSSNTAMDIKSRSTPYSQEITYHDIARIAHSFGVSYPAVVYRLRSLNLVSYSESEALSARYKEGKDFLKLLNMLSDLEATEDAKLWDRELRSDLVQLMLEAYRRHEISRGFVMELAEKIGISGKSLCDLN